MITPQITITKVKHIAKDFLNAEMQKEYYMKDFIKGPSTHKFYGKEVNLNDVNIDTIREQKDATFMYMEWFSLASIATNPERLEDLNNMYIRETQISEEDDYQLEVSFLTRGLDITIPPICVDQYGNVTDGRRRSLLHIKNGELVVPVARYRYDPDTRLIPNETEYSNGIGNGLYSNNPYNPARTNVKNDWVWAGIEIVREGVVGANYDDIYKWFKKYGIEERYPDKDGKKNPAISDIINKVLKRSEQGFQQLKTFNAQTAKEWVSNCDGIPNIDGKTTFLVNVNQETYWLRFFEDMINQSFFYGSDYVADVILYTTATDSITAEIQMKKFDDYMIKMHEKTADMFGLNPNKQMRRWRILGCLPQNSKKHKLTSRTLIKLEDYKKKTK